MKKFLPHIVVIVLMIIFILVPYRTSDLEICLWFGELEEKEQQQIKIYYAVDSQNNFSEEHSIVSDLDPETNTVLFHIDSSLEGRIVNFRVDFPEIDQLVPICEVAVYSAGVIKKKFNPCDFFAEENIRFSHGIDAYSLVRIRETAYFHTTEDDPFLVMSDAISSQITGAFSHYRMTRFWVCVFFCACFWLGKKRIFKEQDIQ